MPRLLRVLLAELLIHLTIILPAIHLLVFAYDLHHGELSFFSVLGCAAWVAVVLVALIVSSTRPIGPRWRHLRERDADWHIRSIR